MRVLLVDRDGAARQALAALLRDLLEVTLVGEIGSRDHLADAIRRLRPHVVVIDDRLLGVHGHALAGAGPTIEPVRVIVVSVDDDPAFAARARRLGAEAWIAKDRADDELPRLLKVRR